jgi:hypothetical protein
MTDVGFGDLEIHGLVVNKLYEAGRHWDAVKLLKDKRPIYCKDNIFWESEWT